MRNLDLKNVYVDNNGNPLHGRITFYNIHTTEKAPIYSDKDGTYLNNPCYTNILGQTEVQVFLDDIDYTLKYEKYIGQGDMNSDESASSWVEVRTVDSLKAAAIHGLGTGIVAGTIVATTEELREVNPDDIADVDEEGHKIVQVDGRYVPGDMPPVYYRYVEAPSSTYFEDGGSIIASDSTHYWELITPRVLDVRIFGVFPAEDYLQVEGDYSNFRNAFTYANEKGIDVYIPQVYEDAGYYLLTGGTYSVENTLIIDAGVKISGKTGQSSSTLIVNNIKYDGEGPIFTDLAGNSQVTLYTDTVKVSWLNLNSLTAIPGNPHRIIIDTPVTSSSFVEFNGAEVYILNDINGGSYHFINCSLDTTSRGRFSNATLSFTNCKNVSDRIINYNIGAGPCNIFSIDSNTKLSCADFVTADTYINWMNVKGDPNYGDLLGRTINGSYILSGNVSISNANGNIYLINTGMTNLNLSKFTGNVIFPNETFASMPALFLSDSSVYMTGTALTLSGLIARRTALGGTVTAVFGTMFLENCTTDNAITVLGDVTIKNSTINANVVQHNAGAVNIYFSNNSLNASLTLYGDTAGTIINGTFTNNNSTAADPIILDRTNLDPIDSHHHYTYSGNSGTFLPYVTEPANHEFTIRHSSMIGTWNPPTEKYVLMQMVLGGSDSDSNGTPAGYICVFHTDAWFDTVKFFRIGIDRFRVNAKLVTYPQLFVRPGSHDEYKYSRYQDAQLGAYFIDGYTFGIQPFWDDPSASTYDKASTVVCPFFFVGSLSFSLNNMPSFTDYHSHMEISYECMDKHL